MNSHLNEQELAAALDRCDALVRLCAAGRISFDEFCDRYDNFYWSYALDGHESDTAGLALLAKYAERISPHQAVAEAILAKVIAGGDIVTETYRRSGRMDSAEAVAKLELVAMALPAEGPAG